MKSGQLYFMNYFADQVAALLKRRQIFESDILDELTVCPYCMYPVSCEQLGCCGESSAHFADAYDLGDELVLACEVDVIKDEQ